MAGWLMLVAISTAATAAATDAQQVTEVVRGFYRAFNAHDFSQAEELATPAWNHINPSGGRTVGRAAVLKELREVHATFLRQATDTPESIDVEILAPTVALATVRSRVSGYVTPDGVRHTNEPQIRTFVLVKTRSGWKITRDHNTIVARPRR